MKIEEQVLSIEQMNHLKELGLKVKDTAVVLDSMWDDPNLANTYSDEDLKECTPTLTLQEILELLPSCIANNGVIYNLKINFSCYKISYKSVEYDVIINIYFADKNIINAAYKMLCWVLENGYLKDN